MNPLLLLPLAIASVAPAPEAPQVVDVGVYVMNVGKFELATGSFTIDFYLTLKSDRAIPDGSFEFMNGRAASVDVIVNEEKHKEYRVLANLYQNLDLRAYPFDRHKLTVLLENKSRDATSLVWRVSEPDSGLDPEVTVVGWDLTGSRGKVDVHDYGDKKFSRFVYEVELHRIVLTSIFKAFLPAFFIVVVGLLSLLMLPDKVVPRLGMATSALLGTVMFHLTVTSQIPPVGYLTFADRFMIASYIVLLGCLISTVVLMRHSDSKDNENAMRVYRVSLRLIPPAAVVVYAVAILTR
jgi:hypothetical protein